RSCTIGLVDRRGRDELAHSGGAEPGGAEPFGRAIIGAASARFPPPDPNTSRSAVVAIFGRRFRFVAFAALSGALLAGGLAVEPVSAGSASVVLGAASGSRSPGDTASVTATVTGADGLAAPDGTMVTFSISGPARAVTVGSPAVGFGLSAGGQGGWLVRSDGSVTDFGTPPPVTPPAAPSDPEISLAATPTGAGYWTTTSKGLVQVA